MLSAQGGDPNAGQVKSATCAACHGADGNSMMGAWPSIAGQHESYLQTQITAIRDGERLAPLMVAFASNLTDQDISDLSAYYANQAMTPKSASPESIELGQLIYLSGDIDRGLPACTACHGPDGRGNPLAGYPSLAGQHAQYTALSLNAYANGTRQTIGSVEVMRDIATLLTQEEVEAVSNYVQGLR
ncbi:MAG: c-type cytochrome [Gammaproteobacteria bacterium]